MINPFEELKKQIELLQSQLKVIDQKFSGEKRWLNIKEASHYLGYSKDYIHKLKNEYLIEGKHYHKKAGRVLFDKYEIDNWVTTKINTKDPKEIANDILEGLI